MKKVAKSCYGTVRPDTIQANNHETKQRENERYVHGWMSQDNMLVDNHSLQWRHQRSTYDGHHEEGRAKRGIHTIYAFQGNTINGREHQRHEETNAYQAIQARHSHDENGSQ